MNATSSERAHTTVAAPSGPMPHVAGATSVQDGMALLDKAQRRYEVHTSQIRTLAPENLRGFQLLRKNVPEKYLQEFRQMRSRLQQVRFQREAHGLRTRSLLVTSPSARQGKTFVAMNLALMIAVDPAARVLIVDLNVRRPTLQSRFRLPDGPGLEEFLAGAEWTDSVWWMPDTQLYLTTLGAGQRDSMDPLPYDKLSERLREMDELFDWVILDGPPLLESPDAEIASHLADSTLLVIRKERTSFAEMDECASRLAPGRLAGVVYNSFGR